ncbi:hypothetical protein ACROYT_G018042 [Oculina patagonica]
MLNVGLPLVFICLVTVSDVSAQAVPCKVDSITVKDPVTGLVQCQDCLKCPAGEGLSVNCGDVITPKTPLACKPCVLGETYSSAYEAGACKDCENCGQYRETTKPCTLTSKAECGKCESGAYAEPMLGMCRPCSPCCNDGNDIVVPECQVPGVPTNTQCSYARSVKCSKMLAKAIISTATPSVQTNHSKVPSKVSSTATSAMVNSRPTEQLAKLPHGASPPREIIVGSVIGGVLLVFIPPLVIFCYCIVKRRIARKKANDLARVEADVGQRHKDEQGNDQANDDNQNGADEPNPAVASPEETSVPIQESGDKGGQEQTGPTQETQPPDRHGNSDVKPSSFVLEPRPDQGPTSEIHSPAKVTVQLRVEANVDTTSGDKPVMV